MWEVWCYLGLSVGGGLGLVAEHKVSERHGQAHLVLQLQDKTQGAGIEGT